MQLRALISGTTYQHFDLLVTFTEKCCLRAIERAIQKRSDFLRRSAQQARFFLIDIELDDLGALVPVELHIHQIFIGAHDVRHLHCQRADGGNVIARHAELHREADRWAVFQALYTRTRGRKARVKHIDELYAQFFARLHAV